MASGRYPEEFSDAISAFQDLEQENEKLKERIEELEAERDELTEELKKS